MYSLINHKLTNEYICTIEYIFFYQPFIVIWYNLIIQKKPLKKQYSKPLNGFCSHK